MIVTSGAALERQDLRLGWLWASVFLHGALIGLIGHVRSTLPRVEPLAPTTLVGTSFDVFVDEAAPPKGAVAARSQDAVQSKSARPEPLPVVPKAVPAPPSTLPGAQAAAQAHAVSSASEHDAPPPRDESSGSSAPAALPEASSAALAQGPSSYGQEGKEGAPAQLRRAFIKMLPLAAKLDESWLSLPAMSLGRGRFVLRLNEQGQLSSVEFRSGDVHPALVRAMQKNRAFLGQRRFASNTPGELHIVVEVSGAVSHRPPQESAEGKVIALGVRVDPKDPQAEPRGAYFTYDSGQHVELVWTLVRDP